MFGANYFQYIRQPAKLRQKHAQCRIWGGYQNVKMSKCQNINISFSVYNMCAYDRLLYCLRLFNVCSEVSPLGGGVSEHVETKQ